MQMQWLASPSPEAQSSCPPSRSRLPPHAAAAVPQTCCSISPWSTGLAPSLPGQCLAGRLGHKSSDKRAGGNRTPNVGEVHCPQPSELARLHWQERKVRPEGQAVGYWGLETRGVGLGSPPSTSACPPLCPLPPGPTPPLMGRSLHRPRASLPQPPTLGPHLGLRCCVCAQACLQLPHHHLPLPLGDGLAALVPCGHQSDQVS